MVFIEDTGSAFDAPIGEVWRYVGSGKTHSTAHRHRKVRRRVISRNSGRYSWEQDFQGRPERFTMRWTAFPPVGIAYEVLEGPFVGSSFFLYYTPRGPRTGVTVAGEFVSPTIPLDRLRRSVDEFFSVEFDQDSKGLREQLIKGHVSPERGTSGS